MSFITFENPKYLALLLAIPLLILIHYYSLRQHRKNALKFANFDAITRISGIQFFSKNLTVLYLTIILLLTLTMANSGMHMEVTKAASDFSFVIAIDSSQSMTTNDVPGASDRFEAAKEAARRFVSEAPISTKIGLISFSGTPFLEQALTTNKDPIRSAINRIVINRVGGTNILNALVTSGNLLDGERTKAVIIISDGQISVDTVEDIVKYAEQNSIVINTIGIGTIQGTENELGYISKLDEEALQNLAYETAGVYARAENQEELNNAIIELLSISRAKTIMDLRYSLITFSILLLLLIFYLSNIRYKAIP